MSTVTQIVKASEFALIPSEEETAIVEMDNKLTQFRRTLEDPKLADIMRASIQAKAILAIEKLISPAMMQDFRALMNSPLGFKTDRVPGQKDKDGKPVSAYGDETIKRCVIVALLSGAKLTGDEFNIIAGQCYLTKKFLRPAILRFPGLTDLEIELGTPVAFGEAAAVEARARWKVSGVSYELQCSKGAIDSRIVVKRYSTSSADEMLGRAERKLYARIYSRLTGMNCEPEIDSENTVDGKVLSSSAAKLNEPIEPPKDDFQTAMFVLSTFEEDLQLQSEINVCWSMLNDRKNLVRSSEWTHDLKNRTNDRMTELARQRVNEIRSTRGERSNLAPDPAA